MPKVRIHELAKELNIDNKTVMEYLKGKKIEFKSHMSTLEEAQEAIVRKEFSSTLKKKKDTEAKAEVSKKKSNIIQVFRPQNATSKEAKNYRRLGQNPHSSSRRPLGEEFSVQKKEEGNLEQTVLGQTAATVYSRVVTQNSERRNISNERLFSEQRSNKRLDKDRQLKHQSVIVKKNYRDSNQGNRFGYVAPEHNNKKDIDRRGGFDNRSQRSRRDREKKSARDIWYRTKDKNENFLRENTFVNERCSNATNCLKQGRRTNQHLSKVFQKPECKHSETKKEEIKKITLPVKMTIQELAERMNLQPSIIVKKLFLDGIMVTVNQEIDFKKAQKIALEYDIIAEQEKKIDVMEVFLKEEDENESFLAPRPPVVCVMGHVDHGKTLLLDAIRNAHVTDCEAGGITQHIGAYGASIKGKRITFLDTPGHEAFTAMRMRGVNSTDIAVLVVAADDGVMPQTIEAINHAKAAGVEIIVAINKIDKPSANVKRVKQELSEYELIPEDWGGSTVFVLVSAKTHEGINNLLEMILLTAEVLELKANPKRHARGLVLEAKLDKGKGPVANLLIQKGTLHVGDYITAGACSGRVRAMIDENSKRLKEAGPSTPVEVLGLNDIPNAGEILMATKTEKEARNFAATFVSEGKNKMMDDTKAKMSLDDLYSQIQKGSLKELKIVVKADVQGSVEAIKQSLVQLSNDKVVVKIVHGGVGSINESDVTLASASNAIIIGFNIHPDVTAKAIAEQEGVDIRLYRVIYQAIEDVEAAIKGMLDPIFEEKVIGHSEIRQLFKASGVGTIAGSYVLDGFFQRGASVRITRKGKQIFDGHLASIKRFKDDVKEVKTGYECGLMFDGFNDIQELDQVEAYIMVKVSR
ncbi:MAG: translation initiation factor IF-2 [Lachnospiraceae bacterium]|nr:translation initiation factor IF-2 [Lachnospiraceae bacterium]